MGLSIYLEIRFFDFWENWEGRVFWLNFLFEMIVRGLIKIRIGVS